MRSTSPFAVITAISVLVAQPAWAQVAQVTTVRLNSTANGLELILEGIDRQTSQVFPTTNGTTFQADISNARLALPSGQSFRQDNPAPGIESVTVTPLATNRIRVTVIGSQSVPTVELNQVSQGLQFGLSVPSAVGTTPPPPGAPSTAPAPTTPRSPATAPSESSSTPSQQEEETIAGDEDEEEVVVTATRTEENQLNVPRSVTVIPRESIEQQANLNPNLGNILGKLVPGFGPPSDRAFTGASLRGRDTSVLIDGVPQDTNSRDFDRDLRTIDPSAIERVEVLRGPTAIYGAEATGGVINIITRRASQARVTSRVAIGTSAALGKLEGESFGFPLEYSLSGREGRVDYTLSLARTTTGSSFDSAGDRIPIIQGTDDSTSFNGLAKLGVDLDAQQRLQFSLNYFNSERETDIISDPIVNQIPGVQKARAREVGTLDFIGTEPQSDRNTVLNLNYSHKNIFGSQVQGQLYYRDNTSRTDPRDRRNRQQGIFQGVLDSQNWGGRLQINTPLAKTASLLWGLDYTNEDTESTRNLFDPTEYDATNGRVYRKTGEVTSIPPYQLSSLGLFAQAQWDIGDRFILSGGLRHERADFQVGDYTTLFGDDVQGGERDFNATVFNVGAVYKATRNISLFANFAQGFSVPDFGSILFAAPAGLNIGGDQVLTEPQRVNSYEVGVKGQWSSVQASLSGFYSTSKLGTSFVFDEESNFYDVVRSPERTYGIEATLDVQVSKAWQIGGSASLVEGEFDEEDTGDYTALTGLRIPPLKLVAYVENETLPGWRNRLQALFVGNRDRAFKDDVDPSGVTNYFTVDYISSIRLGGGSLQIGIENLFDIQYFPAYAQRLSGLDETFNSAGRGRTVSVRYVVSF